MITVYIIIVVALLLWLITKFEIKNYNEGISKLVLKNYSLKKAIDEELGHDTNTHHYTFSEHAKERMKERRITHKMVKLAIKYGQTYNQKDIKLEFQDIPKDELKELSSKQLNQLKNKLPLVVCTSRKNSLVISTVFFKEL